MLTLIRAEMLKLRTVRWPWVLLAAQVGLVVLGVTGYAASSGDKPIDPQLALQHVGLTSLLTLVLGIMAVAAEYRDGTITDTFLASPGRARVVGAKLATFSLLGFVFAVLTAAAAVVVTAAWLAARGSSLDLGGAKVWETLVGAVLWDTGFTAIGVGLGAMLPNVASAITLGLAWVALVEGLVGQLIGSDLARWLPMYAGQALEGISERNLLAPWGGGLVLAAYAAIFGIAGALATVRRDVT